MKNPCDRIQERLVEEGRRALGGDRAAREHLAECSACFAFLEALAEVEGGLARLPALDAPDQAVEGLLARVAAEPLPPRSEPAEPAARPRRWWPGLRRLRTLPPWALASAAATLLLAAALPILTRHRSWAPEPEPAVHTQREVSAVVRGADSTPAPALEPTPESETSATEADVAEARAYSPVLKVEEQTAVDGTFSGSLSTSYRGEANASFGDLGGRDDDRENDRENEEAAPGFAPAWVGGEAQITFRGGSPRVEGKAKKDGEVRQETSDDVAIDEDARRKIRERLDRLPRQAGEHARRAGGPEGQRKGAEGDDKLRALGYLGGDPGDRDSSVIAPLESAPAAGGAGEKTNVENLEAARAFLTERQATEGLALQRPRGYWANTYVPGDPLVRWLEGRLRGADLPARLAPFAAGEPRLRLAAKPNLQPFDPPRGAALAVYLHADRPAVAGRSRVLVQVGLQASERQGGSRPAAELALVLDLRETPSFEQARSLRALVNALAAACEVGDRFHLLAAGRGGGAVVEPESFRSGPLGLALDDLVDASPGPETLDLPTAVARALERVAGDDDPNAPLGSRAVLVAVTGPLGDSLDPVASLAHRGALAGVPLSAIGIGEAGAQAAADAEELARLALAGQGRRRLLEDPAEAPRLVERELASGSQAVARAVRLSIRLAPGVELVEVLGSHRLDEQRAERVREAEQSLDLRLARSLGITADRGEDEDGIQIVIPALYSGASHAILLDVVVPGPGPVADVAVRSKDLVALGNGLAAAHLELDAEAGTPRTAGPLERNVLENLLAQRLHRALDLAGRALWAGDAETAVARLAAFRDLLAGLGTLRPELSGSAALEADLALLDEYVTLLRAGAASGAEERQLLAASLRYASRLRLQPTIPLDGGGR